MNPLNYASPEASKRLAEAGILLETEAVWRLSGANETYFLQTGGSSPSLLIPWGDFPAPCMAEIWRKLPRAYTTLELNGTDTIAIHRDYRTSNTNPTDALIDLLILVRKEADHADK